jgi:hypothetical protein
MDRGPGAGGLSSIGRLAHGQSVLLYGPQHATFAQESRRFVVGARCYSWMEYLFGSMVDFNWLAARTAPRFVSFAPGTANPNRFTFIECDSGAVKSP